MTVGTFPPGFDTREVRYHPTGPRRDGRKGKKKISWKHKRPIVGQWMLDDWGKIPTLDSD